MSNEQEVTVRQSIVDALRNLAPGYTVTRIWGRTAGATADQGQEGNAWAADVEDIADLAIRAMRQAPDLH